MPENKILSRKSEVLPKSKQHLENLGFVVGGTVTIVNTLAEQPYREREGNPRCDKRRNGAQNYDLNIRAYKEETKL